MRPPKTSVNHRFPSGPAVMLSSAVPGLPAANLVICPLGLTRTSQSCEFAAPMPRAITHTFPSGPFTSVCAPPAGFGSRNCANAPLGVTLPSWPRPPSTNQTFASGPGVSVPRFERQGTAQSAGIFAGSGTAYSTTPPVESCEPGTVAVEVCGEGDLPGPAVWPEHATTKSATRTVAARMRDKRKAPLEVTRLLL